MKKSPRLFFLCYPHIGTLDNWMSIVNSVNNMESHLKCTLIIPKVIAVRSFHMDNAVVKMSNDIFDTVLVHAYDGTWIKHASVFDSIKWYQNNKSVLRILNILIRLMKKPIFPYILRWLYILLRNKIYSKKHKLEYRNLNKVVFPVDILFYDIAAHGKTFLPVSNMLRLFENNNKYSLPHAVTIQSAIEDKSPALVNINNKNSVQIYVHAKCQIKFYEKKYNISVNRIHLVGIPRHDHAWIKKIQEESPKLPDNFDDENTVIVISKRVSGQLSFDEKVETLKDIKKIFIDRLCMRVAIKLHPSENKERIFRHKLDNIYEDIFGMNNYGLTWIYSNIHVLALCKGKKLVITLGGCVVYDIIALSVPCVEYKNKKENAKIIATQFVKYGFVEGVSNYNELNTYVENWRINSSQISKASENTYRKFFPLFDDSSRMIADEILNNKIVN